MTIQSIETHYSGFRFRSRLEARWAVFFDYLEIKWDYEPQGYKMGGVYYLPDFWLPSMDCYVEVKGVMDQPSTEKIVALVGDEIVPGVPSSPVLVLGEIPSRGAKGPHFLLVGASYKPNIIEIYRVSLMIKKDGIIRLTPYGWPTMINKSSYVYDPNDWYVPIQGRVVDQSQIEAAYTVARMARFEHGESGTP